MLPKKWLCCGVSELKKNWFTQLQAEVLCRRDRLDLMVKALAIGAMNVNAAMKYYRRRSYGSGDGGGDRVNQLAALKVQPILDPDGQLPHFFYPHQAELKFRFCLLTL